LAQDLVNKVAQDFPGIDYRVLDLTESPEIGIRYAVHSTPAIVINGKLAFNGVPKEKALRKKLESSRITRYDLVRKSYK
jgi:hypothetical protein